MLYCQLVPPPQGNRGEILLPMAGSRHAPSFGRLTSGHPLWHLECSLANPARCHDRAERNGNRIEALVNKEGLIVIRLVRRSERAYFVKPEPTNQFYETAYASRLSPHPSIHSAIVADFQFIFTSLPSLLHLSPKLLSIIYDTLSQLVRARRVLFVSLTTSSST